MKYSLKKPDLAIWLSLLPVNNLQVSELELTWSKQLQNNRKIEFLNSRFQLRNVLSDLFQFDPKDIPLEAPPGKPPILKTGFGFVSLSHCNNSLLMGWSNYSIGVDIESSERSFEARKILERFYSKREKNKFSKLNNGDLIREVMNLWVIKEAAIKSVKGIFPQDLQFWEINEHSGLVENIKTGIKRKIFKTNLNKFTIAVAYDQNIEIKNPIICII